MTDAADKRPSVRESSTGYFLSEERIDQFRAAYVPDPANHTDPRVSPLRAENLSGLPQQVCQ
ncbi:MAG: alpha/beta hydrolase fold domain-containing protein [Gordonia sp. (in: high G+C Gram-positive bacteria)]